MARDFGISTGGRE